MQKHHSIACYDKNLCLKPNIEIWVGLLFLLKPYLVLLLSVANLRNKSGFIDLIYADRLDMSLGALAGVPAVFLMYALLKRKPGASPFVKSIWARGRILMAISALLSAVAIWLPIMLQAARKMTPGDWAHIAIALLIVILVYTSSYIRDCFNDFPADEVAE